MYVRTGVIHLLNTWTGTFTPSEVAFDTVQGGIGSHLGDKFDKLFHNHDRRPGVFRGNSQLAPLLNQYVSSGMTFEDIAYEIGKRLYDLKVEHEIYEESVLIILSVNVQGHSYLMGVELERKVGYLISHESKDGKGQNVVKADNLIIPNIDAKKSRFFTIKENNLEVSTLENLVKGELYLFSEALLQADMGHSINWYVSDARKAYYSALKNHVIEEDNPISLTELKTEEEIEAVNYLEDKMKESIKENSCIDFYTIGKNQFFYDQGKFNIFLTNLQGYSVDHVVHALSDAPLKIKKLEYIPERMKLKHGMELVIPSGLSDEEIVTGLEEVELALKSKELEEEETHE